MHSSTEFNFFNILIIVGAIQGTLFSTHILIKNKFNSNYYLAFVILFLSLNNLYYSFIDTGISQQFKYYECFYLPYKLLVLPMYFFFLTSYLGLTKEYKRFKKNIFIPFILFFLLNSITNITNTFFFELNKNIKTIVYYSEEYFSIVFSLAIIIRSLVLVKEYEKGNFNYNLKKVVVETKWLKQILASGIIVCVVWVITIVINHINNSDLYNNFNKYFIWVSITLIVYLICYLGIFHNDIFNQRQIIRNKALNNKEKKTTPNKSKIKNVIENEKLYLNPSLSLADVAQKLNLNETYVSHTFNLESDLNFSNYINSLRIKNVKKLLLNEDYKNYTLLAIALESGFNSKSAFYNAFKKDTGLTPTQYRQQNLS